MLDKLAVLCTELTNFLKKYYDVDKHTQKRNDYVLNDVKEFISSNIQLFSSLDEALCIYRDCEIPNKGLLSSSMFYYRRLTNLLIKLNKGEDISNWSYERHQKRQPVSDDSEKILDDYSKTLNVRTSTCFNYLTKARFFLYELEAKNIQDISTVDKDLAYEIVDSFNKSNVSGTCYVIRFIRYLAEEDCCPLLKDIYFEHAASPPKESNKQIFSINELNQILNAIDTSTPAGKRDYAIMQIACQTILRSIDIALLKLCDIDFENNLIKTVQSKSGKLSEYKVDDECISAIRDYIEQGRPNTEDDHLFIRERRPYRGICKKGTVQNIFKKYRNAAGVEHTIGDGRTFHGIRRTVASRMAINNEDIGIIAEALGHGCIDTVRIYTTLDASVMKECSLSFEGIEIMKGVYACEDI